MANPKTCFTLDEAQAASEAWGFNCGPAAVCALLGLKPEQVRPHLGEFERKRYTNPTLMRDILKRCGVGFKQIYRGDDPAVTQLNTDLGLLRIQWGGPWTRPGVPMRVRYRHSHWIAMRGGMVFDINAISVGGWIPAREWSEQLVPWLCAEVEPKWDKTWWVTHVLEVGGQSGEHSVRRGILELARDAVDNQLRNGRMCPNDTDGDGDCGRPGCPVCGTMRPNHDG